VTNKKSTTSSPKSKTRKTHTGASIPKIPEASEITLSDVALAENLRMVELEKERLRAKRKVDADRQNDKIEVDHYVVVVFQTYSQKLEFTEQLEGIANAYGDYYDGEGFAEKVGLSVTPCELPSHKLGFSQKLADMVDREVINDVDVQL